VEVVGPGSKGCEEDMFPKSRHGRRRASSPTGRKTSDCEGKGVGHCDVRLRKCSKEGDVLRAVDDRTRLMGHVTAEVSHDRVPCHNMGIE